MGSIGAEDLMSWEKPPGMGNEMEEKILVLVRLRPLSDKEIALNEVADWECINSTTILYRNSLQERTGLPTAYSFDRVFRGDSSTREVYDDGIKDIALSVVGGINSTVFAYGQTSSGKTYTMNGITEYTVADIYDYIQKHEERAFVLKFSATEIYNEVVRDLLSKDNTPLRLLDDPEKGTIIEKLTEETLRDWDHLKELLSICEAQRKIGETSLNETSSRSHQILRLTIESSAREFIGKGNSTTLAASVNFVDLAGSERASQALSVGQRLKEGCHINRSLLTLGTVIRKLSKGRQGHINYRDSKLTRILQPALGGNARTAIICTLSPARSHVEQSRNTLLFATCAKEVSTNAQVNVVMSDKALVKHLQKEVARLENELKTPGSMCDHGPLLRKKDTQIEKLEKEVRELKKQRDLAHSRIDDLLRAIESNKAPPKNNDIRPVNGASPLQSEDFSSDVSHQTQGMGSSVTGIEQEEDSDEICKEVRCIEMDKSDEGRTNGTIGEPASESEESMPMLSQPQNRLIIDQQGLSALPRQVPAINGGYSRSISEQKLQGAEKMIDSPFRPHSEVSSPEASSTNISDSGSSCLTRSRSCRTNLMTDSPDFEMSEQSESTPPTVLEKDYSGRPEGIFQRKQWRRPPVLYGADGATLSRSNSISSDCSSYLDETQSQVSSHGDEDIPTLGSFVAGLKEMAKQQYGDQSDDQVQHIEGAGEKKPGDFSSDAINNWPTKFAKLQKSIIELWQACNVSLIHRTYFVFLIKDDYTDSIYVEVEHRRLSYLKETFGNGKSAIHNGTTLTLASSKKALRRERTMLCRLMHKRYSEEERNRIYEEWGIGVNSKQRKLQLANRLWSDTSSMEHVTKSAAIVAELTGLSEHRQALKEMLGLSFAGPLRLSRRSFRWK
ncbi:kinesin-like protein KIN-7E [Andrographis paniculata]|uniref:kinesin-like protein KIN-7E n=1 Tax=Andrographis paniculata TaxID=175694 RepID=UPI0021E6DDA2|nr:kinesin-like protein KIN-7E [Andrographis paniculata]XP_051144732.1 kinesin-like protein KIN-7E [Andrographis paniculata]XP_051144733.1 kinesin-like protein KIN-7E [Andrographis paniculata]XP_051144734.1 kinesin-like protein KIN-7E [Andrographis paniculata]XP_051144735.1 kinesin-like protein KIN-7E [Andrographis paniculata]